MVPVFRRTVSSSNASGSGGGGGLGVGPLIDREGLFVCLATASRTACISLVLLLLGPEPEPRPLGPLSPRLEPLVLERDGFLSLSPPAGGLEGAG